ncbi:unnamed protein product [Moneuplotes crassus]|uniref:Uncharacterized protein n=1 Tax=Euplotes crassus TaxID=5936 RepID=A0AAD1U6W0_EUPCR|nr:unnamed protein product [Moneuplotes crassus]
MGKKKKRNGTQTHRDLGYITIRMRKKDHRIIGNPNRNQFMQTDRVKRIRTHHTNPTSPITESLPVVNGKVQSIVGRATHTQFYPKTFETKTFTKEIEDPNLTYMNNFKLCIKNFDILKDNKKISKKAIFPMRYETSKAMIEYRNSQDAQIRTVDPRKKKQKPHRRSQIFSHKDHLLINKEMIKKNKFSNSENSHSKSSKLRPAKAVLIKPKLTLKSIFKSTQKRLRQLGFKPGKDRKEQILTEYFKSLRKKDPERVMRSDTAKQTLCREISPANEIKRTRHHISVFPPKNEEIQSMRAVSPEQEENKNQFYFDRIHKQLKNTLDEATHLEDYTYHFATRNLKDNKIRFKSTKIKFDETEIKDFLNIVKMGKEMILYKTLMKNPNLVHVSDSMGRTPVHWAVIREETECLRILLHFKPSVEIRDLFNQSPLDIAFAGTNENIKLMLQNAQEELKLVPERIRKKYLNNDLSSYAEEILFASVSHIQKP